MKINFIFIRKLWEIFPKKFRKRKMSQKKLAWTTWAFFFLGLIYSQAKREPPPAAEYTFMRRSYVTFHRPGKMHRMRFLL